MNPKIILAGIIFLAILGTANASAFSGNFSVSCDCLAPAQAVFTLNNSSSDAQAFKISSTGANSGWISLNGKWIEKETLEVALSSGESKNLYAFIKPQSCYTQPGIYTVTMQGYSAEESFSQGITVTVTPSRTITLDVNAETFGLKQCEQKNFSITISNTGKSDELIQISAKGLPSEWLSFSKEAFLLEKGRAKQVLATIKPDCAAEAKEYPFSFQAAIINTNFSAQKNLVLKIIDAQQIEMSSAALTACKDKETTAQVKIKNNGRLADSLEISASGPAWLSISPLAVSLNPNEEKALSLAFKRTDAAAKEYPFVIVAHSKTFNKDSEKELAVKLQDCYGVSIAGVTANGSTAAVPSACIEEPLVYEFSISNDKTEPITVDISLTGANALVSPSRATMSPGRSVVFKATLDISKEKPGDKNFGLSIRSDYFSLSKEFSFRAVGCYALKVDYDGLAGAIDVNASDSAGNRENPFTVKVMNTGTRTVRVKAEVLGPGWVYFQPDSFSLNAGDEKGIYLYFDPGYDTKNQAYKTTLKISAENFSDAKEINANVYGGLYGAIGTAAVSASGELDNVTRAVEKTVEMQITIKNDSNSVLKITDLNAYGYSSKFVFAEKSLAPQEEMQAKMTLFLGKGFNETKFSVPVRIFTDKGTIVRDILVDLNAGQKQLAQAPIFGWLPTGSIKDITLIALIAIVLALIIVVIFKSGTAKQEEKEGKIESYWQAPEDASVKTKALSEISRKIKSRPKTRPKAKKRKK
ncbi:MAG: hypothetical protein PHH08_01160 [Candidatus ainarchaeum sp.]|nr:hypothetical protein [Candidatus ainarchaeum sp.]